MIKNTTEGKQKIKCWFATLSIVLIILLFTKLYKAVLSDAFSKFLPNFS